MAKEVKEFNEVLKVFFTTAREGLVNKIHSQSRAHSRLSSNDDYQRLKEMIYQNVDDVYKPMNQGIFYKLRQANIV